MIIRRAFATSKRYTVEKPTLVCALANFNADFGIICFEFLFEDCPAQLTQHKGSKSDIL